MNLGVLDWVRDFDTLSCNVYCNTHRIGNHGYTSQWKVNDLRRSDLQTEMKVLVEESYRFVGTLSVSYVARNSTDLWYVVVTQ